MTPVGRRFFLLVELESSEPLRSCISMSTGTELHMSFVLHERLARGSFDLGVHGICRVLLKDQAHFPWILLVPEVDAAVTELHHLSPEQYDAVSRSMRVFSRGMADWPGVQKINIAAIGNQVPQLHIHIVGRHPGDIAWPGVVWSCPEKQAYAADDVEAHHERIRGWMKSNN
ncbi:MAG: hypothetical protein RLZZ553_450 [Verrucomicrobiota bacterium]